MGFTLTDTAPDSATASGPGSDSGSLADRHGRDYLKVMTIEYTEVEAGSLTTEPVVELFCRDAAGERRRVNVHNYAPHFHVTEGEFAQNKDNLLNDRRVRTVIGDERLFTSEERLNGAVEPRAEPPVETLTGEDLVTIETIVPGDVAELREEFTETWEADVFFTDRFLIDADVHLGVSVPASDESVQDVDYEQLKAIEGDDVPSVNPRMCTVDIEVWSGGQFPDPENPTKPVTAITAHDSYTDEYLCGVLHPSAVAEGAGHSWAEPEAIDWELPDGVSDEQCSVDVFWQEHDLLAAFNEFVIDTDPDLLTGWNSSRNDIGSGFDYPYLINRCERINELSYEDIAYERGSVFVTNRGAPNVAGREMFDMLQAYKKTQIHEKRSYSLGYIADDELGYGKEDIDDLDEGWLHNPVEFVRYNVRDVEAVHQIEAAKSVLDIYDHIRSIAGATYSEIADSNIGIIDMLFLRQANSKGYALPTSTRPDVQHYWGAYVFQPQAGKHQNVVYPDLSSLYPNLFRAMNASPETIVGDEQALADSQWTKDDCHVVYVDPRDESVKKDADEPEREALYVLKPEVKESFVREIVQDLIDMKYEYKSDEYSGEAYGAIKRITNCFTADTDVVTPDGIVNIRDLTVGDTVYSVTNDGQRVEEKAVTDVWSYPDYTDELVTISNSHTDFAVTPNHELLVNRTEHTDSFEATMAGELNEYTRYQMPSDWDYDHGSVFGDKIDLQSFIESHTDRDVTVRTAGDTEYVAAAHGVSEIPRYIDTDAFIELLGWYVTEGSTYDTGSGNKYVIFTQDRGPHADRIESLIDAHLGNYWEEDAGSHSYKISSHLIGDLFEALCGKGSENKMLPQFVFEMSQARKELLFETLIRGDGDTQNGVRYTTVSPTLKDDVAKLCVHLGRNPRIREDESSSTNHLVYRIRCSKTENEFRMHRDGGTATADNGVYCVTVEDNHTLLAGRNGNFQFVKQSVYGVMGDSVSYGKGFRLFDWQIAEAITLAGRDVIKHTAETFADRVRSMGYSGAEIIAGDTDSCVCTLPGADGSYSRSSLTPAEAQEKIAESDLLDETAAPVDSPLHETVLAAINAAEYVDMTYDEFMKNRFNIDEGYMAVEIESYAESALFMDAKKRYAQWIRWDEGDYENEVEVKGFELVRSDSARITGEVQYEVLEKILKQDDPKPSVADYLTDEWTAVTDGAVDLERLGTPSAINNPLFDYGWSLDDDTGKLRYFTPQPHIRGARYAKAYIDGEDPAEGSKPLMFYTTGIAPTADIPETYAYDDQFSLNAPQETPDANRREMKEAGREVDAVAVEDVRHLPDAVRIDYEKMGTKTVRDPVEPILEVLGWDFDDLTDDGEQTGLAAYM